MARLAYVDPAPVSEDGGALINRSVNISRLMAHSPGLVRAIGSFSQYVRQGTPLSQRLVEIGILTIAWEARSAYEWAHHLPLARRAGMSDDELAAIKGEGETAEPASAIIGAARDIAHARRVDDTTFATLETKLGAGGLVDLAYFLGVYTGIARFLSTFDVEVEAAFASGLTEHPFP